MNENERLQDVLNYHILDTPFESELNELAIIASAICDTPIALLTIIGNKRQWFKAKLGMEINETKRKDSFCQHSLHNPSEVLVIEDTYKDNRVKNSMLVTGEHKIRFYAGAPLNTPNGNVLGTICVMDRKPRTITEHQKKALQLMAKRVMKYLDHRKLVLEQKNLIDHKAEKLKKLADLTPGIIYQFQVFSDQKIVFQFISGGVSNLYPDLDPELVKRSPEVAFNLIHPNDIGKVKNGIHKAFDKLIDYNVEYRVVLKDGAIKWHSSTATPEKQEDGSVIWYGTIQDISSIKEYEEAMEQIAFDISHVLRRPVASLLGLVSVYEIDEISNNNSAKYIHHIKNVSKELDEFTRKLNNTYAKKCK